jgi:CDGSH-type Zn-finger protein
LWLTGYNRCMTDTNAPMPAGARSPEITLYPDGPMLVRGEVAITLPDGTPLERRRRVVALCRCGRSALSPLCDGTHKLAWRRGRDDMTGPAD